MRKLFIIVFALLFALPSYSQWGSNQQAFEAGQRAAQEYMAKQHKPEDCPGEVKCENCNGTGVFHGWNPYTGPVTTECYLCKGKGHHLCNAPMCRGYRDGKKMQQSGAYYAPVAPSTGGYSSPSTGSSSNICRICKGGGICTSCNGTGGYYVDSGTYTGYDTRVWYDCPSCHGSKRCFNCHGTGKQ